MYSFLCIACVITVQIVDLVEVTRVALIDLLRSLNLRGNPLRELPDYRLSVIFAVQQLTELDLQPVDIAEKVNFLSCILHHCMLFLSVNIFTHSTHQHRTEELILIV